MLVNFRKILFLWIAVFLSINSVFASDNVLQAIQIDGTKDSYNIILRSDDTAEVKTTIQAPNKMMIVLKGIRASKTINTIYNNTSSVDSIVVEPTGDDSIKILVQAVNVANAKVHFDSLETPLGVLGNPQAQPQVQPSNQIFLSDPMNSYTPIYENNQSEEETNIAITSSSSLLKYAKKAVKNEKISWMITFGLFGIFLLSGMKLIKGKDNDIKIGLRQSLQSREINMYKDINSEDIPLGVSLSGFSSKNPRNQLNPCGNTSGTNYGLRAYQNSSRSPYATPEIQRPRPVIPAPATTTVNKQSTANISARPSLQATMPKTSPVNQKPKTANIDSMKFLESMTKIYEKNGRSDLAQGLKSNMKKAKMTLV